VTDKGIHRTLQQLIGNKIIESTCDHPIAPTAVFEIPMVAKKLVDSGNYAAVITLGAVIRGATAHFDYVAGECAKGIAQLSMESKIPVIFGVLTTDTIEQAIERAGTKAGNKGSDCALAALEMTSLLKQL